MVKKGVRKMKVVREKGTIEIKALSFGCEVRNSKGVKMEGFWSITYDEEWDTYYLTGRVNGKKTNLKLTDKEHTEYLKEVTKERKSRAQEIKAADETRIRLMRNDPYNNGGF